MSFSYFCNLRFSERCNIKDGAFGIHTIMPEYFHLICKRHFVHEIKKTRFCIFADTGSSIDFIRMDRSIRFDSGQICSSPRKTDPVFPLHRFQRKSKDPAEKFCVGVLHTEQTRSSSRRKRIDFVHAADSFRCHDSSSHPFPLYG